VLRRVAQPHPRLLLLREAAVEQAAVDEARRLRLL